MYSKTIGRLARVVLIGFGLFGLAMYQMALSEEVYNFYFQKGPAPQTVIQGGGGQTAASKAVESQPVTATESPAPLPPAQQTATPPINSQPVAASAESTNYKPFTISLGYAHISDPVGGSMNYTLGFQYNFNRFLGVRAQGRFRNIESSHSDFVLADPEQGSNKWGGMAALAFTPLKLDLLGHRFIEFSALAGAETYRKLAGNQVNIGISPLIGGSAMLGLNENVGIELQVSRSIQATTIGGNIAFQF